MRSIKKVIWVVASLLPLMWAWQIQAAAPQLRVIMFNTPMMEILTGETRIGHGVITADQNHTGFKIGLNNLQQAGQANCYRLQGENNLNHNVFVCLKGEGWQAAEKGQGIVIKTTKDHAEFNVVINGDQHVVADSYSLTFTSQLLTD